MKMYELYDAYAKGGMDKKIYWTLVREQYTSIIPQLARVLKNNEDCKSILIEADNIILQKQNGVKLYFDFTQSMCRAEIDLAMGRDPEKDGMEFVESVLKNRGCRTVLDIGANVGLFSLDLYRIFQSTKYYLFEPIPTTYEKMQATLHLNHVNEELFRTLNMGLSDKKGSFKFFLPAESEAASLRPVNDEFYRKRSNEMGDYTGSKEQEEVTCQVSTLDAFVLEEDITDIDFIKIDVEGNEKAVLEGAKNTIMNQHPLIYCELLRKHAARFGYHPNDVINFMKDCGYHCGTVRDCAIVKVDEIFESTSETNFLFWHSSNPILEN